MASDLANGPNAGDMISKIAQVEGGTSKDSVSAQLQSQLTKERNAQQAEKDVLQKLFTSPTSVTTEDAAYVQSREARVGGVSGLTSVAHKMANANQRATIDEPTVQSAVDRTRNYMEAADKVEAKMEADPSSITKEDGDLLHSRETRAFGITEKGGLASQAQSLASRNAGET